MTATITKPSLKDRLKVNGTSSKKRKLNEESEKVEEQSGKASREERREAKRRRKLEKKAANDVEAVDALNADSMNDDREKETGKKARKEEKRRLKTEKRAIAQNPAESGEKATNGNANGAAIAHVSEKKAAREAKRQEKARRTAERKAKTSDDQNTTEKVAGGTTKPCTKSDEEAETYNDQLDYREDPRLSALPQVTIDSFLDTNHIIIQDFSTQVRPLYRPILDFSYFPSDSRASNAEQSPFASFKSPTPIQASAWPNLLCGRDVIGVAETGSGKTLAFGVPCIRRVTALDLSPKQLPARAVIVSPTRELAVQIHSQIKTLAASASLQTVCVYGGVSKETQYNALKQANIIVATPGRLNDLLEEGAADLSYVKYVVLDEADRMLDKGFEDAIRAIFSKAPSSASGRQTCMFTATWPSSVRDLAATFMKQPIHITIGEGNNPASDLRANKSITQTVEVMEPAAKEGRLRELIKQHSDTTYSIEDPHKAPNKVPSTRSKNRILVFCLYKKEASRIETMLRKTIGSYVHIAGIHGDMSQPLRTASLQAFKSGAVSILVATDVAARGLDIPDVKVVINFTFPLTVEDYVHRIGRTGRAGREGLAVTFFTELDKGLAGGLVNVLKAADQEVPEELMRFGTTVKRKGHEVYGNFYREVREGDKKVGTMVRFD